MFSRIKLIDIELSRPLGDVEDLNDYTALKALVRLHGAPIGYVEVPVTGGTCTAAALGKAILDQHGWSIICHYLSDALEAPLRPGKTRFGDLLNVPHPLDQGRQPPVTVAVCTRDRAANLRLCLDALNRLDYPSLDLMVVHNAPRGDATEHLVRTQYPNIRYVCEPRPGLDWARNRAIVEARGDIVAFTDDDVIVDPGWVRAFAAVFVENPEVMAVTGLVVPHELETEAQYLFELYGGFGRGFVRRWYHANPPGGKQWPYYGAGQFGTGANMAFRRHLFDQIGYFDPALDVGTVTNGGGDLEMFFRILKEGHTLVYEPGAIVRHRHRRDHAQLRTQIANNGIGLYSYLVRSALAYRDEAFTLIRFGLWWMWWWNFRRLLISLVHPTRLPRDLILAELKGGFIGLGRYRKARQAAARIADAPGPGAIPPVASHGKAASRHAGSGSGVGIRTVDVSQPLPALGDVKDYKTVRIFVTWKDRLLGSVEIASYRETISASRLSQVLVDHFGLKLVEAEEKKDSNTIWVAASQALSRRYLPGRQEEGTDIPARLPVDVSASIVVSTYDRPDDLRECLRCLIAQQSKRDIEIIVVDNNPRSGLTPPIVTEFPGVVLVSELRKGLAYARNSGIVASRGDLVIMTDDDVRMPPEWLENLVAPFLRPEVMIVTGNILPLELETKAQLLFEAYGGLGRGFSSFEAGSEWFFEWFRLHAVPTWNLGATANAAFRATIFGDPRIGLLDEALGPGTPTGVGEDTYVFYKALKAGYTLVYQPTAYVWHKHRRDMTALRRQIYNYSKGHVAYHLTTLIRDHDLRALFRLMVELPWTYLWRIRQRLLGGSDYPLVLVLIEIAGNLAGAWALWRSQRRVKRDGRSAPYVPVLERVRNTGELLPLASAQFSARGSFNMKQEVGVTGER